MPRNATLGEQAVGNVVKARVDGTERNFIVVHHGKPSSIYSNTFNSATILLLVDLYENRQWHSSNVNDYANSTIHSYLNSTFLNLCATAIKNNVVQVKIPYRIGAGESASITSGESGLAAKIWLPSGYEVGLTSSYDQRAPADGAKFNYFFSGGTADANTKRIAHLNGTAADWWLRSPFCNSGGGSAMSWRVYAAGNCGGGNCSASFGIRPALALPSSLYVTEDGTLTEESGLSGVYVRHGGTWKEV